MSGRSYALNRRVALEGDGDTEDHVLVDTHTATLCACNDAAWRLLFALRTGATVEELTAQIEAEFEVAPDAAKSDVLDFIGRLSAMGLIDEN
ncbi:MAG: PqqD family protein [Alphaproteobacteria bacterium]|nr:PqqD family protein [Alphaproteobacteria bacterium]